MYSIKSAIGPTLVLLMLLPTGVLHAQQLLRDDFNDVGIVDPRVWRLPFGDSEGTVVGRTQFRGNPATDMPLQGVSEALADDGLVLEIDLDTYNPGSAGSQFLGTDILTKRNFTRAGGISLEARMRLKPTTAGGLVNGFFLFDVVGTNPLIRDEIDWELISNQAVGAATQDPFTNYWDDGTFDNVGSGAFVNIPGLDLTQFQNYKVEWTPSLGATPAALKWYVNNSLVRTATTGVPDDPMKLHFNIWAPDETFGDAFNAALMPASTSSANQRFKVQVDWVEVNRLNTTETELLVDGSFEFTQFYSLSRTFPNPAVPPGSNPATQTGEWYSFNNSFLAFGEEVPPSDGLTSIKLFGPFTNLPNASGMFQNAAASAGQEFEASIMARSASFDSIRPGADGDFNDDGSVDAADYTVWRDNLGSTTELPNDSTGELTVGTEQYDLWRANFGESAGSSNYAEIVLEFRDITGNTILGTARTPIFDGRDANLGSIEDEWINYTVNGIAPVGTAFVRYNIFFQQSMIEGGALHFDEASLLLLTPNTSGSLASAAVPEPSSIATLCLLGSGGWLAWSRLHRRHPAELRRNR